MVKRPPKKTAASEALRNFRNTLMSLVESPQFPLLRNLPISHLLGNKAAQFSSLSKASLDDLVQMLDAEISPLISLKPGELKTLAALLLPLTTSNSKAASATSPFKKVTHLHPSAKHRDDTLYIGASEAERRLLAASERVRDSSAFSLLCSKKLGEFWNPDWPRAPFEECMTFRQFAKLNMDQLLKKRSFGIEKILAVLKAVEQGLSVCEKGKTPPIIETTKSTDAAAETQAPPELPSTAIIPAKLSAVPRLWKKPSRHFPSYCHAMLRFLDTQHALAQTIGLATPCARLASLLPQMLGPDELSILWILTEHPLIEVAPLFAMDVQHAAAFVETARGKLRTLVEQICPEVASFWAEHGGNNKLPEKLLIDPYVDRQLDRETQLGVLKLALQAFVAR